MSEIREVNQEFGDKVSDMLYAASKLSWENRPGSVVEMHPSFSGWRALRPDLKPADCYEGLGSDGIGTKVEISERLDSHSTAAIDLFAMACDDAVVRGAEPIAITTVLDVNNLDDSPNTTQAIRELAAGYLLASVLANVIILNGETAELGDRVNGYGRFNYNWGATVLWYAQKDRIITGLDIVPGQSLVGLGETGFRSNGITDARSAMLEEYGPNWHNEIVPELGKLSLGRLVQDPSTIYSKLITELTGGYDVNRQPRAHVSGIAHITGGGLPEKLGRMLEPTGLGALIDRPMEPPAIMLEAQRIRKFDDIKSYGKWHMGQGMVIATNEPDEVIAAAHEKGIPAKHIGITKEQPGVQIRNQGGVQQEEWLHFMPKTVK
jgi:phosphoribosylformylglycinamidine cyclo-ligase